MSAKPNRRYYDHRRQPSGAVLSFCRVNDLDTALNHIFPLPTGDIFSNRMVWFEDKQISAELVQMRLLSPELWGTPLPLAKRADPVINAEHDGRIWRRIPEPAIARRHRGRAS